ncbi:22583_t:CDS:2 [Cetraspora pellucida]|uniref:22583_t:CDS:1 n=1 Tax=Cetraspora pellucida TaxID=1433469 RepID=A0A9N9JQ62_9GLOM|nr:22583_t:CDS:2 [Cetraspora pellucida]
MVKTKGRSQVQQYLNPTATSLTPEAIEKIRDAHAKQIPNRKCIICANYKISSERYDDILIKYQKSEQVISLSKPVTKKTSRKKKVSQNEELPSSNINKTNSNVELSKDEDRSKSKTINYFISSIPGSDVQARMENL